MAASVYTDQCLEAIDRWPGVPAAPSAWSRQFPQGIAIMRHPLADRLIGQAHPILPGVWFGPLVVWGCYRGLTSGQLLTAATLFVLGILIWSLAEYLLHRFLFHFVAASAWGKKQLFFIHGYHHEFPNDKLRLVAPIFMSWPLGIAFGLLYYLLLGAQWWMVLFAGSALGYIAYDWIHYYTHHFVPKNRVGKWLRKYHLQHHYKDGTSHFGISNPFWDLVFGTFKTRAGG